MFVGAMFLALFGGLAHADKVDDFVQAEMKRHQIPGLSLGAS